ncbi:hypothetical protein LK13_00440 [Paenibacillus polymyxa]|uniref:hypothetical protein n=1 Tax=Paenibacillus polymyxa TaxID=1406 RepID=UPI00042E96FC|nr:hypothetical protein [Paenibacillus polymyxa]AHM66168.1 hypothetical protein PPSQR21_025260 [Paenibacillus polymyxa SQR-21]AIY07130.1 hypothetical protein LK13_00440 [Paenibacillus polymyxa]
MAKAYLQITLKINAPEREAAAKVYTTYKEPFLSVIPGAVSKELLVRDEDVQVLHGFNSESDAKAYLESDLFNNDVVVGLKDLLQAEPEIRIYSTF